MKKEHSSSIIFTIVSFVGSFLIIGINIIKQYVTVKNIVLIDIVKSGDIYIICASMAITAIYNLYYFKDEVSNKWPTVVFFISIFNYTASLIFYFILSMTVQNVDNLFAWSSAIIFILNLLITYLATYYQNLNTDVISMRQRQTNKLQNAFSNSLGDK